jgi:hypothetical protein
MVLCCFERDGRWLMSPLCLLDLDLFCHSLLCRASNCQSYLLSRQGARELMQRYFHAPSGKFDLSSLNCINSDLCLFPTLSNTRTKLPPHFIPYENTKQSIILADSSEGIRKSQADLIEISRVFARHWTLIARPDWVWVW